MIGYAFRDVGGYVVLLDGEEVGFVESVGEGAERWTYWHYADLPLPCAVLAGTGPTRADAVAHHHHPDLTGAPS